MVNPLPSRVIPSLFICIVCETFVVSVQVLVKAFQVPIRLQSPPVGVLMNSVLSLGWMKTRCELERSWM
jgi:hypothetical protein